MIHEKQEDRDRQNMIGHYLAQLFGATWEPTEQLAFTDGYLHKEACFAAVEIKWRNDKYEDLRVDVDKIENLLAHANESRILPMFIVRTPGELWMRVVTQKDTSLYPHKSMTLNKPRDAQDIDDKVIAYPWDAFQLIQRK